MKPNVNLDAEAGCSTNSQLVDQGSESLEDGTEEGNGNARDGGNRVDSSTEHSRDRLNSQRDIGESIAGHIGSLAQANGETLEGEFSTGSKATRRGHALWHSRRQSGQCLESRRPRCCLQRRLRFAPSHVRRISSLG